jgi:UDP-N-acetylglucosamine--N-acetylmuramyl-(pentapeptide) pyrophosphoryl-undecaprenol N-acetylglucosamine transferase
MSRFLIACGGSGGHLSPGIALAEELLSRGHSCTLLVSRKQVDSRLSRKYEHIEFVRMPGAGFSLRPLFFLTFLGGLVRGMLFANHIIRKIRPDVVIGFGGFTTAALTFAARMRLHGPLIVLHEANRVPGRAIRMAGPFARRVYLPEGVRRSALRVAVVRHCSLPVRRELQRVTQSDARREFGLETERPTLLVLGGSQGARPLNQWVEGTLKELAHAGIQVICVSGPAEGKSATVENPASDGSPVRAVFIPFCDEMGTLMSVADLAVSRAGAGTLAELARMHLPASLVTYPQASDDHQTHNARFFEQQGGGFALEQNYLRDLTREATEVISNDWLLEQFRQNLQRMDEEDPASFIVGDLEKLLQARQSADRRPAPATA